MPLCDVVPLQCLSTPNVLRTWSVKDDFSSLVDIYFHMVITSPQFNVIKFFINTNNGTRRNKQVGVISVFTELVQYI